MPNRNRKLEYNCVWMCASESSLGMNTKFISREASRNEHEHEHPTNIATFPLSSIQSSPLQNAVCVYRKTETAARRSLVGQTPTCNRVTTMTLITHTHIKHKLPNYERRRWGGDEEWIKSYKMNIKSKKLYNLVCIHIHYSVDECERLGIPYLLPSTIWNCIIFGVYLTTSSSSPSSPWTQ